MIMNKIILILLGITILLADVETSLNYSKNQSQQLALDQTIDSQAYIVGPGDRFSFSMVTSSQVINQIIEVSPTGDILIPLVGRINLDAISLANAFELIKLECKNKIPDSTVNITLISIKNFKILVIGPKNIPTGYRMVNSSDRLLDVFTEIEIEFKKDTLQNLSLSSRNIVLERQRDLEQPSYTYDLEKYKINGIQINNPYLRPGDILKLDYIKNYVSINGAVMVPGLYEYRKGDSLSDLLNLCGGLSDNLALIENNVEILRYVNDSDYKNIYMTVKPNDDNSFELMAYDQILIKPKSDYKRGNTITIKGEILNPGVYSIDENTTIKSIILRSGGYTSNADLNKIIINNEEIDRIGDKELNRILALNPEDRSDTDLSYIRARARSERGSFSHSDFNLSNSVISDYKLFNKDIIYIPRKYSFVEVIGAVRNPGRYPFNENLTIQEYIERSGGVTKNATNKYFIIQSSTGDRLNLKEAKDYKIKSQDIIFIEEKNDYNSWDRFKDFIEISSQVLTILAILNGLGG